MLWLRLGVAHKLRDTHCNETRILLRRIVPSIQMGCISNDLLANLVCARVHESQPYHQNNKVFVFNSGLNQVSLSVYEIMFLSFFFRLLLCALKQATAVR